MAIEKQALNGREVAQILGLTPETFYRKRNALEASGFPHKIPGITKWSRPAIMAWLRRNGEKVQDPDPEIDLEEARGRIDEALQGGAA